MEYTPRMLDNALVSRSAAAGSMVLLKNAQNTLPLIGTQDAPVRVAVFGIGQIFTPSFEAGLSPFRSINILDGLCAEPTLHPDRLLAHKYRAWALEHPDGQEYPLATLSMQELAENNDSALIVIARSAAQYQPVLTNQEHDMIRLVQEAFSRTILILATPGYLELTDSCMDCGAIVFMGLAGQEGGYALADLLTARVMPGGHLAHSWPEKLSDFDDASAQNDIFSGYRYFDSCNTNLRWPFGYGLGYGTCSFGSIGIGLDGNEISVSAEVVCSGQTWPASELVQVFVSHPGSAQPVYTLQAFEKTAVLSPGESETVQIQFPVTQLAVFHEDASAFVLEEGYYDIRIGTNSRTSCIAGSIRVTRSVVVQAIAPIKLSSVSPARQLARSSFTYYAEAEELAQARRHAIRLSDRNLPRLSRKKGHEFTGCRADGNQHTLQDVKDGSCNLFQLIASMDEHSLRTLVCEFGFCKSQIPGALGASCELSQYKIPAMHIAAGAQGLHLKKDICDEDGTVVRHQYCTAFPCASTLACSFDPDLIRSVGKAIGREMAEYGVDLWYGPGAQIQRTPRDATFAQTWSEDPVVCGLCAGALAQGISSYAAAILHDSSASREVSISHSAMRDLYACSFEIASHAYKVCQISSGTVCGQNLGEDSALIRSMTVDWKYTGMFLAEADRFCQTPSRIDLEKAALRILKFILDAKKSF